MADLSFLDEFELWQERAAEARALADTMSDPETKRLMHGIADAYEHLARRAEERKEAQPPGSS